MDVAVSELRAQLSHWLERVRGGDEVVVTERGIPVARIVAVDATTRLEQLAADGVIAPPATPRRPRASGRERPTPRRPVSDLVGEQRR